jgi:hypothetical protein
VSRKAANFRMLISGLCFHRALRDGCDVSKNGFKRRQPDDLNSIGHQEFDLKLTDRVKMRMVGVPEAQFEQWASKVSC